MVLISIIKEGVEDTKRHKADAKVNARKANAVNRETGQVEVVEWKDLIVGRCVLYLWGAVFYRMHNM